MMALNINGFFPGELQATTTVGGCIDIFENAWPNPQRTIDLVEEQCEDRESNVYWQRAITVGSGPFQDVRTNKILEVTHLSDVTDNSVLQNIHNQFNMLLLAASNPYAKKYIINETFWHEGYQMLKYQGGEEYKAHYDGGTGMGRAVSAIVYLNDDYEGGHLEFPNFGIKIKPQAGMLILFPSNYAYAHTAHPVTKGTKYALVTWIRDRHIPS
jgi:predicted 2-oxoglutarate/Fe(II)-dependent dioxygenase YbiX